MILPQSALISGGANTLDEPPPFSALQIEFARHVYDNQQALLRQLDTKAGVLLSILVFLTGATLPLAKDLGLKLHLHNQGAVTSWIFLISSGFLVCGVLLTAFCTQQVITTRGSSSSLRARGLMYAEDIRRHGNADSYHEVARTTSPSTLLYALNSETFELSLIAVQKMKWLAIARWPTLVAGIAWSLNMMCILYIAMWK